MFTRKPNVVFIEDINALSDRQLKKINALLAANYHCIALDMPLKSMFISKPVTV